MPLVDDMPSLYSINSVMDHYTERQTASASTPIDTSTHASRILGISGAFTGVALAVVLARMFVRVRMLKTVGADDYFIMAATV